MYFFKVWSVPKLYCNYVNKRVKQLVQEYKIVFFLKTKHSSNESMVLLEYHFQGFFDKILLIFFILYTKIMNIIYMNVLPC